MTSEIETRFGNIEIEQYTYQGETTVTIKTVNWIECAQEATLTRKQFAKFIETCQEILAHMPE